MKQNDVWELYEKAKTIICKLCRQKVYHKEDACCSYIENRLLNNNLKELEKYDESKGASVNTYLHNIIRKRLLDFLNSSRTKYETHFEDEHIDYHGNTKSFEDDMLHQHILEKAFKEAKLSNKEIALLKYKYIDEYKYSEIPKIGKNSPKEGTVKKAVENARNKLKKALKRLGIDLEDI